MRPTILLSPLRKIVAISPIDRCCDRMKKHISLSQAACQSNRSTTEQVFFIKVLAEKSISSENYDIFLLLLDMSKAFDVVDQKKLMNILGSILIKCELHMMHVLINDVILNVKIGNMTDWDIHTNIRILTLLFILYLAFAVKPLPPVISAIDYHRLFWSLLDWIINRDVHKITIDWKYADDISFLRSEESKINQVEREIPAMLLTKGLHVNGSKTEKYHIQRSGEDAWKKCKYLGSLLDTDKDIKREKGLIIDSYKTFESIFSGKHVSEKVKIRVFAICIQNIFMYNSDL